jgi:hypothetical protein
MRPVKCSISDRQTPPGNFEERIARRRQKVRFTTTSPLHRILLGLYKIRCEEKAFWSVTGYDKDDYFIANPIDRYAIGDRDQLKFNADGSLDLLVQAEDPGPEPQSNGLPSGDSIFNLTMRLYWPKPAMLDGGWHPPAVERLPGFGKH